jgi:hypothetical protein
MKYPSSARFWAQVFMVLLILVLAAGSAWSQQSSPTVPRLVKYSGTIADAQDVSHPGTVGITFAVYTEAKAGAPLWIETQNVEVDELGRYTVLLGAASQGGLPLELFVAGEARWLGAQVNLPGRVEEPRVLLVSVPYALKAADADTVGGKPVSAFVLAEPSDESASSATSSETKGIISQQVGGTGTTGVLAKFTSPTTVGDSLLSESGGRVNVGGGINFSSDFSFVGNADPAQTGRVQLFDRAFQGFVIRGLNIIFETLQGTPAVSTEALRLTQTGRVGIGTNNPQTRLDVTGSTTTTNSAIVRGVQSGSSTTVADLTNPPPAGVRGETTAASNFVAGVLGITGSTDGVGVAGGNTNVNASNNAAGVAGLVSGSGAVGVYAENTNTGNNFNWGVLAFASSMSATAMQGEALATSGPAWGVNGLSHSSSGVGVRGDAFVNSSNAIAVQGDVGGSSGTIFLGSVSEDPVFRVNGAGKGFFDGGTQTGGADFAESLDVLGDATDYQAGDLLVIDETGDRRVSLARAPYSTLVAGIYSTKPGVLATPYDMDDPRLAEKIPLAIVGIVPCKVSAENGPIRRGDLLVTSSIAGHAMKGTDRKRMLGAIVGKALEPFDPRDAQGKPIKNATGVIQVLVTLQ